MARGQVWSNTESRMVKPVVKKKKVSVGPIASCSKASSCCLSSRPVKTSPPLHTIKPVTMQASIGSRRGAVAPSGSSIELMALSTAKAQPEISKRASCLNRVSRRGNCSAVKQSPAKMIPRRKDAHSSLATRGKNANTMSRTTSAEP
eukprot:scaffold47648_cov33-Tisochrysis_lutea.AAC.2